jgi:sugar phosphate isomerase/epimerase
MEISLTLEYTESGSLADRLTAIAQAGIPAVNLGTSQIRHLLRSKTEETRLLSGQIDSRGLAVDWVHAPFRIPVIYDAGSEMYHLSMGAMKCVVDIAAELGGDTVIIHAMNEDFPEDIVTRPYLGQLVESYTVLVSYARERGVKVAVENIDEPYSFPILQTLFDHVNELTFCFDTGHAQKYQVWNHYIPRYIGRISALHIHDNHGEIDEHLIPGDGIIDFSDLCARLESAGYNGYLGVECVQRVSDYPGTYESLPPLIKQRMADILAFVSPSAA